VFIIDLAYTLPLLVACVLAWRWRESPGAQRALAVGLALSTAYLGWSFVAKAQVDRAADQALAAMGLQDAPRFSVPMPFNTLLWRVVVMTPEGYLAGQYSVVADEGPMVLRPQASDVAALGAVRGFPAASRLLWFNRGFMAAQEVDGQLVLADLRMGVEPDFTFRFVVAERDGDGWKAVPPTQADWPTDAIRRLPEVWHRIWTPEPTP
jgi:inner membrane protein